MGYLDDAAKDQFGELAGAATEQERLSVPQSRVREIFHEEMAARVVTSRNELIWENLNWLREQVSYLLTVSSRTTAQATQPAPTEGNPSDAAWLTVAEEMLEKLGTAGTSVENLSPVYGLLRLLVHRPDYMTHTIQASSQSAQVDTQGGPVQLNSGFAHCGRPLIAEMGWEYEEPHLLTVTCQICDASWRLGRIPVPHVTPILSTSVKQDLKH